MQIRIYRPEPYAPNPISPSVPDIRKEGWTLAAHQHCHEPTNIPHPHNEMRHTTTTGPRSRQQQCRPRASIYPR